MQKVLAFLLSSAILVFGLAIGCDTKTDVSLPCSQDHNCDTTQRCYKGSCTNIADIPKETKKDAGSQPDKVAPKPDKAVTTPDQTAPKPDKAEPPKTLSYPAEPYGADVGDVAIPLDLSRCDGQGKISFKQYYKHKTIKVIQVTVHTIWCPSCRTQSQGLEGIYKKYKSRGLEIMYIMTENAQAGSGRVSASECMHHVGQFKFSFFPLLDSGSKYMRKYFDRNAVPLNLIITTKDMKIRYKKSGALPTRMNGIIESYLQ